MDQRQSAQPAEQFDTVLSAQDFIQGIARVQVLGLAVADCQQMQFVVAQHRDRNIPQVPDKTQAGQGLRAAVDQVAGKPEPVRGGVEPDLLQQIHQFVKTSLEIADGKGRHR